MKRKLELDDVAGFKTPVSKSVRPSCVTKDVYSSYTGEHCNVSSYMMWYDAGSEF